MARHRVPHYPEARARPGQDDQFRFCGAGGEVSIKDFPSIKKKGQSQGHHLTPRLKPYNFAIGHFLQNAF